MNERGVGEPGGLLFVAIVIKSTLKLKLPRYLDETYNRSARVLFPDYAGFLEFGAGVRERQGVK